MFDRSRLSTERCLLLIVSVVLAGALAQSRLGAAEAAGPWQAQVVSAETKQPLEGVVVLAWWTRHVRSFGGPSEEYRDSQELLTDKDGRFTIESRWFFSLNPLVFFRGPFFVMFKSGYGRFGWPGYETLERERRAALSSTAKLLLLDGIVLEMPPLADMQQRREYVNKLDGGYLVVPIERRPLLQSAIIEERRKLGYQSRLTR